MSLSISLTSNSHDPQTGTTVMQVQNRLLAKGYSVGRYGADGDFGKDSDAATRRFQTHEGLLDDGVVGPLTWGRLVQASPTRKPAEHSDAVRFADMGFRLVTQGIDGTRPRYVFGAETSMHDPSPDRIDCSELVQWAVTQIDGHTWVDGSRWQYEATRHISVGQAIATKGALLFRTGNGMPSGIHHVAISMGNGMTAEAKSTAAGCGSWSAKGRFQFGGVIPVLSYR